jgi:hypothetical protein
MATIISFDDQFSIRTSGWRSAKVSPRKQLRQHNRPVTAPSVMYSEREPAPSGSNPKAPDQPLKDNSQAEAQFPQATLVCEECGKQILCLAIKFSECHQVLAYSWLWEGATGYACRQCRAVLCNDCRKRNFQCGFAWSRWKDALCGHYYQPFRPGIVFLPPEKPSLLRETLADQEKPRFSTCWSVVQWPTCILTLPLTLLFSIAMIDAVFLGHNPGKSDMISGVFIFFSLLAFPPLLRYAPRSKLLLLPLEYRLYPAEELSRSRQPA